MKRWFPNLPDPKPDNKKNKRTKANVKSSQLPTVENEKDEEERSKVRLAPDPKWKTMYPWFKDETVDDIYRVYCLWCREAKGITKYATGTEDFSLQTLKRHIGSDEHNSSMQNRSTNQQKISKSLSKQVGKDKAYILDLIRNMYFSAKNYVALNVFSDLCDLTKLQSINVQTLVIKDGVCGIKPPCLKESFTSRKNYGTYTNPTSALEFLDALAHIIEDKVIEEVNSSSYWSLMIDKTTTITDNKHLAIVSKHITNNIPYIRYLGMVELDGQTAETITNAIEKFLMPKQLKLSLLIHFGSDGASNMTGM